MTTLTSVQLSARITESTAFATRQSMRWLALGAVAGPLLFTLALLILSLLTFSPTAAGAATGVAGLTQRILVLEVQAWFVAMGWLALRRS